jgi:hypothetical protein
MEQIIDNNEFDKIIFSKTKFFASYDPDTGELLCVGPEHALEDVSSKIEIDEDIAEMIVIGKIFMQSCSVNLVTYKLETSLTKKKTTVNDTLFKIPLKKNVDVEKNDLSLFYYKKSKKLKVYLNEHYQKPSLTAKYQLSDPTSNLNLIISDNSDPNCIHNILKVPFIDLLKKNKVIENIVITEKHSIYVKKIFADYALEIK